MRPESQHGLVERIRHLSPRTKQYLLLGSLASVFLLLVFGSMALWDQQPALLPGNGPENLKPKNIATPGAQVDPRDVWMAQSSQQLREMETVIQSLKQKLADVEQKQATTPLLPSNHELPPLPPLPPLPAVPAVSTAPASSPSAIPPPISSAEGNATTQPTPPAQPKPPGIAVFEISEASVAEKEDADKAGAPEKTTIPSGSFMRVALLGGLDAPTGGQAQNNPWPVLMRVQDNAFLPNRYRARVKECFLLGSGYGDISSERAYLRLESLSCVLMNGEVIDANAKGYVVGEDGKAGMRGRLVSKQGQILANALMTGVIAGIGQGFQQSATSYSTSALGTVGTVESGKQFQAGIGAGVGKALDRLSQYYISLAEKTFPIIEIDAGRQADVVLTKGVTLAMADAGDDGQYSDIWRRGRSIMKKPLEPGE